MNILQISSVPISYPGGTEKIIWELSKELSKNNKVTILQTNLYEPKIKSGIKTKEKIKIITCKNDLFLAGYGYSTEFIIKLKKIWKNYDLIHIHGYGRFTSDYSINFLYKKVPTIFTAHGFFHSKKSGFLKEIHNSLSKYTLNKVTFCTALTKLEETEYLNRKIKKEKIRIIPNGFDFNKFSRKIDPKIVLNFKKSKLIKKSILYVGRIHKTKGLAYVIKAMKNINAKLLIIGRDNNYKSNLETLINQIKVKDKILFLGEQKEKDLITAYAACDCTILFSEWEGFGLTILESAAQGKPIVVSDRGALPILVKNKTIGYVVKYGNIPELEKKLNLALNNKKNKQERINFAKNYDWSNISKQFYKLYKEVKK